jgi:methylation protein MtfA
MTNELDAEGFHGIFSKLRTLNVCEGAPGDLYDSCFADFYNGFVGDLVSDIPLFERYSSADAHVLDLACGSGRIGIALAKRGYRVDGLELSQDMLDLVERNLEDEDPAVRARLRFIKGDMSAFALPDRYDLIVIGVTSISLLLSSAQRLGLFGSVREHLRPGGKFIFDILDLEQDRWKALDHFQDVWSRETDEGLDFGIVGQRFFPERRQFAFNVYRERVGWDGETQRAIGTSVKAWLERDELVAELEASGLAVAESFSTGSQLYFVVGHQEQSLPC